MRVEHLYVHCIRPDRPDGTLFEGGLTDGVEYMLEIYKERYGRGATVEGAFIFLKENNVRANFVESLKKTIMEFLGRSAGHRSRQKIVVTISMPNDRRQYEEETDYTE